MAEQHNAGNMATSYRRQFKAGRRDAGRPRFERFGWSLKQGDLLGLGERLGIRTELYAFNRCLPPGTATPVKASPPHHSALQRANLTQAIDPLRPFSSTRALPLNLPVRPHTMASQLLPLGELLSKSQHALIFTETPLTQATNRAHRQMRRVPHLGYYEGR
jgi:hypothetical protein